MLNVKRLKELSKLLRTIPEGKFDLVVWNKGVSDIKKKDKLKVLGECGTSGCAVGWACTHKPFNKQGLVFSEPDYLGYTGELAPAFGTKYGWYAVEDFFGVGNGGYKDSLAYSLFSHESYKKEKVNNHLGWLEDKSLAKPSDVADRIDYLLEHPEISGEELTAVFMNKETV